MNVTILFFDKCENFIRKSILVRAKLQIDGKSSGPLVSLDKWREEKYQEIDREYDRRVRLLKEQITKHNDEITRTTSTIRDLLEEGDVSIDQVKEMQRKIDLLTERIDHLLLNDQSDLVGESLDLGGTRYRIKGRIQCQNTDLYALESEKALVGYSGLCPKCNIAHVNFEPNRGMYVLAKTLQMKFFDKK